MRAPFFALGLGVVPALLATVAVRPLVDHAARRAASVLDGVAQVLIAPAERPVREVFVEAEPADALPEPTVESRPIPALRAASRPAVHGVRVRAEAVLRLANAGARPAGIPVAARGERPAGLALMGVSALGVGLQDGDVLTHAAGRPALTPGDVIGVVIGSRARRVPEISGRFWRNGEPWNLIVEQPYLRREVAPDPAPEPRLAQLEPRSRGAQ